MVICYEYLNFKSEYCYLNHKIKVTEMVKHNFLVNFIRWRL
jgi:hypothetical protein